MKAITKILSITFFSALILPSAAFALVMPQSGQDLADISGLNAQAYYVKDIDSGEVVMQKNADLQWTPASLTKLVTALVILDTNPKLSKAVIMSSADQSAGQCTSGGACIRSKAGVKFTVDGLFHGLLLPSANNAANALARSTGLSASEFADRMNKKAAELGATSSHFQEPTGLDPSNVITASDYSKILTAAFKNNYLSQIAGLQNYYLRSTNNSRYNQTIKNTDKLLANQNVEILGAKTGYLRESGYNFSAIVKTSAGQKLAVVVLGEQHLYSAFDETALLANLADQAQMLAIINPPEVLGTSTFVGLRMP